MNEDKSYLVVIPDCRYAFVVMKSNEAGDYMLGALPFKQTVDLTDDSQAGDMRMIGRMATRVLAVTAAFDASETPDAIDRLPTVASLQPKGRRRGRRS